MDEWSRKPLQEGFDFTWEEGRMVLTRDYLVRRGTCCRSGCRNCPYDFLGGILGGSSDGFLCDERAHVPEAPECES